MQSLLKMSLASLLAVAPTLGPPVARTAAPRPKLVFRLVSAGATHTCGIAAGGVAYCWGDNGSGQLGTGDQRSRLTPAAVADSHAFTSLSAGDAFTCGVVTSGDAYCWGDNKFGQLGNGGRERAATPWPVTGNLTFLTVSAGADYACGVTIDHAAYCWGANDDGQLGTGDTLSAAAQPRPVAGAIAFTAVRARWSHSCGVTLAGHAYCWGENDRGQLGTGTTRASRAPVEVVHIRDFVAVGVGAKHTCGLTTRGIVYCWGDNFWGQMGRELGSRTSGLGSWVPVPTIGYRVTGVTLGAYHTCTLTVESAFRVRCWGSNQDYQLGVVAVIPPGRPTVVSRIFGGFRFVQLDAGAAHTCGTTEEGAVYCWGRNEDGELGDGTQRVPTRPARVAEPGSVTP